MNASEMVQRIIEKYYSEIKSYLENQSYNLARIELEEIAKQISVKGEEIIVSINSGINFIHSIGDLEKLCSEGSPSANDINLAMKNFDRVAKLTRIRREKFTSA